MAGKLSEAAVKFLNELDKQQGQFLTEKRIVEELCKDLANLEEAYQRHPQVVPPQINTLQVALDEVCNQLKIEWVSCRPGEFKDEFFNLLLSYQNRVGNLLSQDSLDDQCFNQLRTVLYNIQSNLFRLREDILLDKVGQVSLDEDLLEYYRQNSNIVGLLGIQSNHTKQCIHQLKTQLLATSKKLCASQEEKILLIKQQRQLSKVILDFLKIRESQKIYFIDPGCFRSYNFFVTLMCLFVELHNELTFIALDDSINLIKPIIKQSILDAKEAIILIFKKERERIHLLFKQHKSMKPSLNNAGYTLSETDIIRVNKFNKTCNAIINELKLQEIIDDEKIKNRLSQRLSIINFQEKLVDFWSTRFSDQNDFNLLLEDKIKQFENLSDSLKQNETLSVASSQALITETIHCIRFDPQTYFTNDIKETILYSLGLLQKQKSSWFAPYKIEKDDIEEEFKSISVNNSLPNLNTEQVQLYASLTDFMQSKISEEEFLAKLGNQKAVFDTGARWSWLKFWNWGWTKAQREKKTFHRHLKQLHHLCQQKYTELVADRINTNKTYFEALCQKITTLQSQSKRAPSLLSPKNVSSNYSFDQVLQKPKRLKSIINQRLKLEEINQAASPRPQKH